MPKTSRVSIVLVNYYNEEDTLACLKSLLLLDSSAAEIRVILVDVFDKTLEESHEKAFLKAYPGLHIVKAENAGFSGSNNLGIQYAMQHTQPTHIMLLNNDTRVDAQLVTALLAAEAQFGSRLTICCPKIYFEKGEEFHDGYKHDERGHVIWYAGGVIDKKNVYAWHRGVDEVDHGQFDRVEQTQFATGCCMLIPRQVIDTVGFLNEKYFLYLEDLDYSERVKRNGGTILFVPQGIVWHKNAGSSGGSGSQTHVYYQTRNRLLYGLKYSSIRTKLALVKSSVKTLIFGQISQSFKPTQSTQKEAIKDAFLFHFGRRRATTK